MNESTVTKMKQMKLYGIHNALKTAIENGKTDHSAQGWYGIIGEKNIADAILDRLIHQF